ncbi:hypothetical protein PTUN_a0338 [Pseudoalteromonas tunicata]|jgi:hypothetical protein|uniref:Uncharacterized protein n=1 Tax=Pseudoalteromonas tunicata D2 TaxID=87626 RepID=A4C7S8_9GAMM|nr:hypothetical protein PTUN_a0338 [Pseudoalteromonas tunicata]EAR28643.1 hypothetical protein PTD2_06364 [Pseudoalteromonas tunicata D2]
MNKYAQGLLTALFYHICEYKKEQHKSLFINKKITIGQILTASKPINLKFNELKM